MSVVYSNSLMNEARKMPSPQQTWLMSPSSGNEAYLNSCDLSLDSGVDGLKDSPGSNNSTDNETEYIVDSSTRTTYLKGKFLGRGGFAKVYEVTDLTTNITYAGKIIPRERITRPHQREKIEREIAVHKEMQHKHIVGFITCFEDEHNVYIILENCPRKSLAHILKKRQTMTEWEARYYVGQLCMGVNYIHSKGIIHRDLKLGNMFLTNNMIVKIGDFGLATRAESQIKGTICGTPNYIPPEVLKKMGHTFKADVWAIGCILYALLVGKPPFETTTMKETYNRIASNKYTIPSTVSKTGRSLITQLLHPNLRSRPCVMAILLHDFFSKNTIPTVLDPALCSAPPASTEPPSELLSRSPSQSLDPVTLLKQDIKRITSSVTSLKVGRTSDKSSKEKGSNSNKKKEPLRSKLSAAFSLSPESVKVTMAGSKLAMSESIPDCDKEDANMLNLAALYRSVTECLITMPQDTQENPQSVCATPLYIRKWIDYSNKYGFGFQLSDRSVGVLFNDNTSISYSSDRSTVEFQDRAGRSTQYSCANLPSHMWERYSLLKYISNYMAVNLTDGGDVESPPPSNKSTPNMRCWARTHKAIIMQLDNGTFQINLFSDHTKLVVSAGSEDHLLTYINSQRQSQTFKLKTIALHGCSGCLRERLHYARSLLRTFAQLEGVTV